MIFVCVLRIKTPPYLAGPDNTCAICCEDSHRKFCPRGRFAEMTVDEWLICALSSNTYIWHIHYIPVYFIEILHLSLASHTCLTVSYQCCITHVWQRCSYKTEWQPGYVQVWTVGFTSCGMGIWLSCLSRVLIDVWRMFCGELVHTLFIQSEMSVRWIVHIVLHEKFQS